MVSRVCGGGFYGLWWWFLGFVVVVFMVCGGGFYGLWWHKDGGVDISRYSK